VQPLQAADVLLSESGLEKMSQASSDELPQGSYAIAELLDLVPRNFNAHVVGVPTVPAVHKTQSTQGIGPNIPAPVCHIISVYPAKIIDQQVLASGSKGFDTNGAYVHNNFVIVVVCIRIGKVLQVGIL
jgi:hypothetical protein